MMRHVLLFHAMPFLAMLCCAVLCCAVLCCAVPCSAMRQKERPETSVLLGDSLYTRKAARIFVATANKESPTSQVMSLALAMLYTTPNVAAVTVINLGLISLT